MTPPVRRKDTGRTPTSERLRELRKSLKPVPSQGAIAERLGEGQMWISRRERGDPEPTVDEAIVIVEALGYAAEFLIANREQGELLSALGPLPPDQLSLVLRLIRILPHLDERGMRYVTGLLQVAEDQAAETTAP